MRVIYSNYLPVKGFRAINLFGVIVAGRALSEEWKQKINQLK
jgi:hypothetical protein